jgi:hypothetical protein
MMFTNIITFSHGNNTTHINVLCVEKIQSFSVKPGGMHTNHQALEG